MGFGSSGVKMLINNLYTIFKIEEDIVEMKVGFWGAIIIPV